MRKFVMAAILAAAASPLAAALPAGERAPQFEAQAARDGERFTFSLAEALKEGPVVLYFYPKANTGGCDMQAYEFGERTADFAAYGARVVGVSADGIDTLETYSADPDTCAGKFAVASDADGSVMRAYDAVASANPANAANAARLEGLADRTSYVIAPDGEIIHAFSDLSQPLAHVSGALDALKGWSGQQAE